MVVVLVAFETTNENGALLLGSEPALPAYAATSVCEPTDSVVSVIVACSIPLTFCESSTVAPSFSETELRGVPTRPLTVATNDTLWPYVDEAGVGTTVVVVVASANAALLESVITTKTAAERREREREAERKNGMGNLLSKKSGQTEKRTGTPSEGSGTRHGNWGTEREISTELIRM
jgi:hypothetical protein